MRNALLKIHMYGGLVAAVYLTLLGISSLQFQHHFLPEASPPARWERDIAPPAGDADAVARARAVRDALGLMGNVNPWNVRDGGDGGVRFDLYRPGRHYTIDVTPAGHVTVDERRNTAGVVGALHGLTSIPNAPFLTVWSIYTHVVTVFGIVAAITGVYLFASVKRDRVPALITLGVCSTVAAAWMILLVYHG
jgi:hypothetical protein